MTAEQLYLQRRNGLYVALNQNATIRIISDNVKYHPLTHGNKIQNITFQKYSRSSWELYMAFPDLPNRGAKPYPYQEYVLFQCYLLLLYLFFIKIFTFSFPLSYSCLLPNIHLWSLRPNVTNSKFAGVAMGHAQMGQVADGSLLTERTYSSSDAYGEYTRQRTSTSLWVSAWRSHLLTESWAFIPRKTSVKIPNRNRPARFHSSFIALSH